MAIRLKMLVEGQTEEAFASKILGPHLARFGIFLEAPTIVFTKREENGLRQKGGGSSFGKIEHQLLMLIRGDNDPDCRFTSMFDFYAFPFKGLDFDCSLYPSHQQAVVELERAFQKRIYAKLLAETNGVRDRFIPFVMLHEFETLIFADPQQLDWQFVEDSDQPAIAELVRQSQACPNPEDINSSPETAPSKRILAQLSAYQKPSDGPEVVSRIGLPALKAKCPHFRQWLERLENLPNERLNVIYAHTKPIN